MRVLTPPPLYCRHCGDLFTGPERDCPSPNAGRLPYKDSGRGGHRFDPLPVTPPKPMTVDQLQALEGLAVSATRSGSWCSDVWIERLEKCANALPSLVVEVRRLRSECRRLKREILEPLGLFTKEQIGQILKNDP